MQYAAFLNYVGLFMSAAQAAETDLPKLASELQENNVGSQAITAQQLSAALSTVQTQGTSGVTGLLQSLGFTDSQIQSIEQEVAAETAPTSAPSGTLNSTLTNLSSSFSSATPGPALAISSPGGLTNQATQTVSGSIDVADAGRTVSIYDGSTFLASVSPASDGTWSTSVTLSGDRTHNLIATATDTAGDLGTSNAIAITLDTQAPVAPTLTSANASGGAWAISGTAEPGATITVYDSGSQLAGTATVNSAGGWSVDTGEDASAVRTFTAVATDAAGNASRESQSVIAGTAGTTRYSAARATTS